MEIFLIWLSTVALSYGMDVILINQLIKDLADNGYLVNTKNKNLNIFLNKLIPFVNLFSSFTLGYAYLNHKEQIINNQIKDGKFKKMTPEEFQEYQGNPTLSNALNISKRSIKQIKNNAKFIIDRKVSGSFIFIKDHPYIKVTEINKNEINLTKEEITTRLRDQVFEYAIESLTINNKDLSHEDQDLLWQQYKYIMKIINTPNPSLEEQKIIESGKKLLEVYKDTVIEFIATEEIKSYTKK